MPQQSELNHFKGTFKSVIDLDVLRASSKEDSLPTEIPILPKGEYMTLPYGNMVLDNNVFEQMIGNFKANVRRAVPLDVDHAWQNTRAAGWVKELINKDDGLWAIVEYTKYGEELVGNKEYKMISAEWSFDYVDPQKSTHHGAVLVAATLTNRPLMQSMPAITASEKGLTKPNGLVILLSTEEKTMPTIAEILAKPVADRTEEELKFLEDNVADFTEEQKTQVEAEAAEAENAGGEGSGEGSEGEGAEGSEGEGSEGEGSEEGEENNEANDKSVTIKASELERLQALEIETKKAAELKAAEDYVAPFVASEKGGKVLPAGKEALVKLASSLNKEQKDLLATVLKATSDQKITKVEGEDDSAGLTATERYNEMVTKLMSEDKMTPSAAAKEIKNKHTAIYKAFIAENN